MEETPQRKKSRLSTNAEKKVLECEAGPSAAVYERAADKPCGQDWVTWLNSNTDITPQWHAARDAESNRKRRSRNAEPDGKKELRKSKDVQYQREKTKAETTQELNDRRTRNADSHRSRTHRDYMKKRRLQLDKDSLELRSSGGVYVYLSKVMEKSICNGNNWIWIQDKKEKFFASDFEKLSQKYAVIFRSYGFKLGDVLHLIADNHYHIFFAMGGCWYLGGIGSLPGTSDAMDYLGQESLSVGAIMKQIKDSHAKIVICCKKTAEVQS